MPPPSAKRVIVGYSQIAGLLSPTVEAAVQSASAPEQSGIDAAAMAAALARAQAALKDLPSRPGVLCSPEQRIAALLQSFLAERAFDEGKVTPLPGYDTLEAKFDEQDWLGWAKSFFTWAQGLKPHAWLAEPAEPEPLPNNARIAVLGDWGTGLYGAPVCASAIERDPERFDLLLHLGDVYYSGTAREIGERFLAFWPRRTEARNRALNSNHEMYTGGYGYFDITLPVFRQTASTFALMNDHWLLVGLDTAYVDHDLAGDQTVWVEKLAQHAAKRRVILFSHHQPFSLFESGGERLLERLSPLLSKQRIFAWYWGHEHRCVVYDGDEHTGLHGRCVGHSGYPYFRQQFGIANTESLPEGHTFVRFASAGRAPGARVLDGTNEYVVGHDSEYGPNGYMTIELDGPLLHECVHTPKGVGLWRNTLK